VQNIQIHTHGYAEPGYDTCENEPDVVLLADWNAVVGWNPKTRNFDMQDPTMERLAKILVNRYRLTIEWEDEWVACADCKGLVRITPNSYGWTKAWYELTDVGKVCETCIRSKHMNAYLEQLEGNPASAVTFDNLDLGEYGYKCLNDESFEAGCHPGQDAEPKLIADGLKKHGYSRFVFRLDSAGQFGLSFSVWMHESEFDNGNESLQLVRDYIAKGDWDGPSRSEALKRGLQNATLVEQELPADGIKMITVHTDGTATGRTVTPEEFVAGVQM